MSDKRIKIDAQGDSRVNAIGELHASNVYFGDYLELIAPRPSLVSGIGSNPPNFEIYWIDRKLYQQQLTNDLLQNNVTEILAEGGFGKSSLASWAYENCKGNFKRRTWVNFQRKHSFCDFAQHILQEIDRPNQDPRATEETLLEDMLVRLRDASLPLNALVVMDQLEEIKNSSDWKWFKKFLSRWQVEGKGSRVLVTTRLQVLSQVPIALKGMDDYEGAAFLESEGLTGNRFADLTDLAEGRPLLLKLAASWTKETYGGRVDDLTIDFFRKLFKRYQGDRKEGVEAIFGVIFEALPIALRELLCGLSVYRLPFGEAMAMAVQPHRQSLQSTTLRNFKINLQDTFIEVTKIALKYLVDRGLLLMQGDMYTLHPLVSDLIRKSTEKNVLIAAHEGAITFYEAHTIKTVSINSGLEARRPELEIIYHACACKKYMIAYKIYFTIDRFLEDQGLNSNRVQLLQSLIDLWDLDQYNEYEIGECFNSLGSAYRLIGKYEQAIDSHYKALKIRQKRGDRGGKGGSLSNIGACYQALGQSDLAITYYLQAIPIHQAEFNRSFESTTLGSLGNAHKSLGNYEQAINFYRRSIQIARETDNLRLVANFLYCLAGVYEHLGELASSIRIRQQSLQIAQKNGYRSIRLSSLESLGDTYFSMKQYRLSVNLYRQSIRCLQENPDLPCLLEKLGDAYANLGDKSRAAETYYEALEVEKTDNKPGNKLSLLMKLGDIYSSLENTQLAIEYHQEALSRSEDVGNRPAEGSSLSNLASCYIGLKDFDQAIKLYSKAISIHREVENRFFEANSLAGLSLAYYGLKNYRESIKYGQQSLEIRQDLKGQRNEVYITLFWIGESYYLLSEYHQALDFYEKSWVLKTSEDNFVRTNEADSHWKLQCIYQKCGRPKLAMYHRHQAYRIWQDMSLPLAAAPFPTWTKNLIQSMGDNWAEQRITSEKSIAWFIFPIGYLMFAIRILLSPLTFLQKKLKIKPLWFWLTAALLLVILIYWLKR
jgi:tetratricopeptide (TPR) repeat protein